jgi:hypothetical protein
MVGTLRLACTIAEEYVMELVCVVEPPVKVKVTEPG